MSWADDHPDPGPEPPSPGEAPPRPLTASLSQEQRDWYRAADAWNSWARARRRHQVAQALDYLEQQYGVGKVPAVDLIAMTLASAYLDGELSRAEDALGALIHGGLS